ncbi:MAG: SRPBCC family protein [Acidimicrobiales bacterium]|nr:SRPBCC family protein [Acidimicrobiales bacterium]
MTAPDMRQRHSINIRSNPEVVYSLVSDLSRMGEWSTENIGGEWIEGDPGALNAKFSGNNKLGDFEWTVDIRVSKADLNENFEFIVDPDHDEGPFVRWGYQIVELEQGSVELTETWEIILLPVSLRSLNDRQLANRKAAVGEGMRATLQGIKAAAEAS